MLVAASVAVAVIGATAFALTRKHESVTGASADTSTLPSATRSDFVANATSVCDEMFSDLGALRDPQSISQIEQDSSDRAEIYRTAATSLRNLAPPADDAVLVNDWISGIETVAASQEGAAHAAYSQDLDAYTESLGQISSDLSSARSKGCALDLSCP